MQIAIERIPVSHIRRGRALHCDACPVVYSADGLAPDQLAQVRVIVTAEPGEQEPQWQGIFPGTYTLCPICWNVRLRPMLEGVQTTATAPLQPNE